MTVNNNHHPHYKSPSRSLAIMLAAGAVIVTLIGLGCFLALWIGFPDGRGALIVAMISPLAGYLLAGKARQVHRGSPIR